MPITGNIFSWGKNQQGQLGDNTKFSTLTGLYPDVFEDATIADYWTQNDLGGGGSFTEAASAGYLTITAGAGNLSSSTFTPTWIYQIVNESDFEVITKMYHVDTINQATEEAGIIVAVNPEDRGNMVGLRIIYGSEGFKYLNCFHFYQGGANNRSFTGLDVDVLVNASPIWFKITRYDETIECFYSTDGINFIEANPTSGQLITSSGPLYVGLWAAQNGSATPFNVSFSDFEVVPAVDPQAVEAVGDVNFIDIAGGRNHSLGLKFDGSLWAWGDNTYGQLGDGTNISKSSPVAVQGDRRFIEVSSSADHSMAIGADGNLYAWGSNEYGQLGTVLASGATPEELGEQGGTIEISNELTYPWLNHGAADQKGMLLERSTGQLFSWGYNANGNLGDGTTTSRTTPVSVIGGHIFINMAGGNNQAGMAIDATGGLWSWGNCSNHRCGTGSTTNRSTPTSVLPLPGGIKAMIPGTDYMCSFCNKHGIIAIANDESFVIGEDGTLYGWGLNATGELGLGNGSGSRTSPVALPLWGKVGHVNAGFDNAFTIGWSDNLLGREEMPDWGYRIRGFQTRGILKSAGQGTKLGNWSTSTKSVPQIVCNPYETRSPAQSPQAPCTEGWYVTWVDQGADHACAADIGKSGGRIFCWGNNQYGQLGNSRTYAESHPVAVAGAINDASDWKDFSCGDRMTCALRASDGTAWCWGYGNYGNLGYGGIGNRSTPTSVLGDHSFVAIHCNYRTTIALDGDGLLWAWGDVYPNFRTTRTSTAQSVVAVQGRTSPYFPADEAQYLLGFPTKITSPINIGSFESAAAGLHHSLAIDRFGSVWAWGRNHKGQLGTGDLINRTSPVEVIGLPEKRFVKVSAGAGHSIALAEDGEVFAWGDNTYNQCTSAGSGIVSAGGGGEINTYIPIPSTNDVITPHWVTDFSQYHGGRCCYFGGITYSYGFFCLYSESGVKGNNWRIDTPCFGPGLGFSNDWLHSEATEFNAVETSIIDPGDYGTTNKFGTKTCRMLHSGSTERFSLANQVIAAADQDIIGLFKVHGDLSGYDFMGLHGRTQNVKQGQETRYQLNFNHSNDGGLRMMRIVNGSFTVIGQNTVPKLTAFCIENPGHVNCPGYNDDTGVFVPYEGNLWLNNEWWWLRFRIEGTSLKGKAWAYGYPMPRHWDIEVEDSGITGVGTWGFGQSWGQLAQTAGFLDLIGIAINGEEVIVQQETSGVPVSAAATPLQGGRSFIDIDAGGYHNIALDENYRAWTWGRNDYGQLGDNSLTQRSTPTSVYGDHRFIDISAGEMHTYALKADGTICTWGAGDYGKLLYHEDQSARSIPYCGEMGAVPCVNQLPNTGNYQHSTLLKCGSSYQAWTWGCNDDGKLGDGSISHRSTPVSVLGNKKWIDMSGGGDFTLGIDENGKIWAWGDDSLGQLGDG